MTTDRPNPNPEQPAVGSRYGTQPYAAPGYGAQPGSPYGVVPEPAAFPALLTLTLTSLALYVLSSLPALFGGEESIERMRDSLRQSGLTPEQVEEIAPVVGASVTVGTIIVLLIGVALYALVYFNLRGAKNWARILGIVVGILGTLSTTSTLPTGRTARMRRVMPARSTRVRTTTAAAATGHAPAGVRNAATSASVTSLAPQERASSTARA